MRELGEKDEGPPELLAVAELPADDLARIPVGPAMLGVVADRQASPGNLGTLIRSADAFGASGVIVTGHAADPTTPGPCGPAPARCSPCRWSGSRRTGRCWTGSRRSGRRSWRPAGRHRRARRAGRHRGRLHPADAAAGRQRDGRAQRGLARGVRRAGQDPDAGHGQLAERRDGRVDRAVRVGQAANRRMGMTGCAGPRLGGEGAPPDERQRRKGRRVLTSGHQSARS